MRPESGLAPAGVPLKHCHPENEKYRDHHPERPASAVNTRFLACLRIPAHGWPESHRYPRTSSWCPICDTGPAVAHRLWHSLAKKLHSWCAASGPAFRPGSGRADSLRYWFASEPGLCEPVHSVGCVRQTPPRVSCHSPQPVAAGQNWPDQTGCRDLNPAKNKSKHRRLHERRRGGCQSAASSLWPGRQMTMAYRWLRCLHSQCGSGHQPKIHCAWHARQHHRDYPVSGCVHPDAFGDKTRPLKARKFLRPPRSNRSVLPQDRHSTAGQPRVHAWFPSCRRGCRACRSVLADSSPDQDEKPLAHCQTIQPRATAGSRRSQPEFR